MEKIETCFKNSGEKFSSINPHREYRDKTDKYLKSYDPLKLIESEFLLWDKNSLDEIFEEKELEEFILENSDYLVNQNLKEYIELLRKFSSSNEDFLREFVVKQFGNIGSPEVLPDVLNALHDRYNIVRCEAVESLAKIGGKSKIKRLTQIFRKEKDSLVRLIAIRQIARHGNETSIPLFIKAIDDNLQEIFAEACLFLAYIKKPEITNLMIKRLKTTRNYFAKLGLSFCLYMHGDKTKIDRILKFLVMGKKTKFFFIRMQAAIFLDYIAQESDNETKLRILKTLEEAKKRETFYGVIREINLTIDSIKGSMKDFDEG